MKLENASILNIIWDKGSLIFVNVLFDFCILNNQSIGFDFSLLANSYSATVLLKNLTISNSFISDYA